MGSIRMVQLQGRFACSCGKKDCDKLMIYKTRSKNAVEQNGNCYCCGCQKLRGKYLGKNQFTRLD